MKIDKQGKTQKKQSKKKYRKTQKIDGGLSFGMKTTLSNVHNVTKGHVGKSTRGPVLDFFHQLKKVDEYAKIKDIIKLQLHSIRFAITSEDDILDIINGFKSSISTIVTYNSSEEDKVGSKEEGFNTATTKLLNIIYDEMKTKKLDLFKIKKNVFSSYYTQDEFSQLPDNIKVLQNLLRNENVKTLLQEYLRNPFYIVDGLKWVVSRHGPSCNNALTDVQAIHGFEGVKVMDPALLDGGIIRLIAFKKGLIEDSLIEDRFKSNFVFVSSLIRTWMTATILYGLSDSVSENPLQLVIAPYLKEHFVHKNVIGMFDKTKVAAKDAVLHFKEGNFPVSVQEQITKFREFLTFLQYNTGDLKLTTQIDLLFPNPNWEKGKGVEPFLTYTIYTETPETPEPIISDLSDFYKLKEPTVDTAYKAGLEEVYKAKEHGDKWYHELNYAYDGELTQFIHWVRLHKDEFLTKNKNFNNEVHVIAHSNLMQSGLKSIDKYRTTKDVNGTLVEYSNKGAPSIVEQNSWTLIIPENGINQIKPKEHILPGILKKDQKDPNWKQSTMCTGKSPVVVDAKPFEEKGKQQLPTATATVVPPETVPTATATVVPSSQERLVKVPIAIAVQGGKKTQKKRKRNKRKTASKK
jgi:hypothetical protein